MHDLIAEIKNVKRTQTLIILNLAIMALRDMFAVLREIIF